MSAVRPSEGPTLARCEEAYLLHFAGQPRLTRDPALLQALVDEAEAAAQAPGLDASDARAARAWAMQMREEVQRLIQVQADAGPQGVAAAHILAHAGLLMHRYSRHFAGQERSSRDLGLLHETQAQLTMLAGELGRAAPERAATMAPWQERLAAEAEAIVASREGDGGVRARASARASAANTLMAAYQVQVVGRRRLACRPALIDRLAADLGELVAALAELPTAEIAATFQERVLAPLREQAQSWQREAAATRSALAAADADAQAAALAAELDEQLAAFNSLAESARPSRAQVGPLCDRLDELFWRLMSMHDQRGLAWAARDALAMVCGHWDAAPA